jgi:hypothetical protein
MTCFRIPVVETAFVETSDLRVALFCSRSLRICDFANMLWVDKYRPTSLDKMDYHKEPSTRLESLVRTFSCPLAVHFVLMAINLPPST